MILFKCDKCDYSEEATVRSIRYLNHIKGQHGTDITAHLSKEKLGVTVENDRLLCPSCLVLYNEMCSEINSGARATREQFFNDKIVYDYEEAK